MVCFFLVMDVQKKIAQRPVGQINKQQPDADLDAAAYNCTSRRRQSAPLRSPRQRIGLGSELNRDIIPLLMPRASTFEVQERLRIASAAQPPLSSQ